MKNRRRLNTRKHKGGAGSWMDPSSWGVKEIQISKEEVAQAKTTATPRPDIDKAIVNAGMVQSTLLKWLTIAICNYNIKENTRNGKLFSDNCNDDTCIERGLRIRKSLQRLKDMPLESLALMGKSTLVRIAGNTLTGDTNTNAPDPISASIDKSESKPEPPKENSASSFFSGITSSLSGSPKTDESNKSASSSLLSGIASLTGSKDPAQEKEELNASIAKSQARLKELESKSTQGGRRSRK